MAYAISAAGPIFAHLTDPELAARFAPLHSELARLLGPDDAVMMSQRYLADGMNVKIAAKGGGISAMPSMHIATATILVIAARRTIWLPVSIAFWLMTFFGSIYLGYHYAIDAPVAAGIAVMCWLSSTRIYRPKAGSKLKTGSPGIKPLSTAT
jgi:membrane-associated phospholipid phosphatase